jgi:hypothetical protein
MELILPPASSDPHDGLSYCPGSTAIDKATCQLQGIDANARDSFPF